MAIYRINSKARDALYGDATKSCLYSSTALNMSGLTKNEQEERLSQCILQLIGDRGKFIKLDEAYKILSTGYDNHKEVLDKLIEQNKISKPEKIIPVNNFLYLNREEFSGEIFKMHIDMYIEQVDKFKPTTFTEWRALRKSLPWLYKLSKYFSGNMKNSFNTVRSQYIINLTLIFNMAYGFNSSPDGFMRIYRKIRNQRMMNYDVISS